MPSQLKAVQLNMSAYQQRILSITSATGSIGFSYFEWPQLVEWGFVRAAMPRTEFRRLIAELVRRLDPEIVVVPAVAIGSYQALWKDVVDVIRGAELPVQYLPARELWRCLEDLTSPYAPSQNLAAARLAERVPELRRAVSNMRGNSRHVRTPILGAVLQGFAWRRQTR